MKIILLLIFSGMLSIPLVAQQTVSSAGSNATGGGGAVSYTVGQATYTANTGTNGSVSQGVQQPYEISVVTGLKEATGITLEWSAYPNPTSDYLSLKLLNSGNPELKVENLSYQLYDIAGKLLLEKKLEGIVTSIQMGGFKAATYILKIISKPQKEIKTFKIIKN